MLNIVLYYIMNNFKNKLYKTYLSMFIIGIVVHLNITELPAIAFNKCYFIIIFTIHFNSSFDL